MDRTTSQGADRYRPRRPLSEHETHRADGPGSGAPGMKSVTINVLRRLHRDESGATATEYMLILALVVLPIALLFPLFMSMVKTYGARMTGLMGLPFP
jgi:Flp pilus assembly pilin Flp